MDDDDLVIVIPLDSLPEDLYLHVCMYFEVEDDGGNVIPALVIEVMEHAVLIDANAPLAGRRVIYEVELLEIVGKKHHPRRTRGPTP